MKKYQELIDVINQGINKFNEYLLPENRIPILESTHIDDPNISWKLTEVNWADAKFPSGNYRGIYFIFGKMKQEPNSLGVYVGKASFSSLIGRRLNNHLNKKGKENKIYQMKDFTLELVATIPLNMSKNLSFFAPALEEYLIYHVQEKGKCLINRVGIY